MNRKTAIAIISASITAAAGCASEPPSASAAQAPAAPASTAQAPAAQASAAPASTALDLPIPPGPGKPIEPRVLVDTPRLKLVTIVLRGGTALPEHTTPVPAMIQAISGAGTVVLPAERKRVDAAHMVILAPGVPHSVEPDAGSDLVLLVSHLRGGAAE